MGKIAIVSTNDIHCSFSRKEGCIGMSGVADVVQKTRDQFGAENVLLVDAGDALGGGAAGIVSNGSIAAELVHKCEYDAYGMGNADFAFGLDRLLDLVATYDLPVTCCNMIEESTNQSLFPPFVLRHTPGGTVAFIGILPPNQGIMMSHGDLSNERNLGPFSFCRCKTGKTLALQVQRCINKARSEGADFVVLLSHLGRKGKPKQYRSSFLVRHISGVDLVIDGHSHEHYNLRKPDKADKTIPILQAGTTLSHVGLSVIDTQTREIETRLLGFEDTAANPGFERVLKQVRERVKDIYDEQVGVTEKTLAAKTESSASWIVRSRQTNLGSAVADAFRYASNAEIALVPSFTIRNDIPCGEITMKQVYDALPLGNTVGCAKVTGQSIADALEFSCHRSPEPCSRFLQVSGISFEVDTTVPSAIHVDKNGEIECIDGPRRVRNIFVGTEPLKPEAKYLVSSLTSVLQGKGGFAMFKGAQLISGGKIPEARVFVRYLSSCPGKQSSTSANKHVHSADRIKFV